MIDQVRHHLCAAPFRPFVVVMSSGQRYRVATPDHANISPRRSSVHVWLDDGGGITLSGLHITSVEEEARNAARRRKRGR